jgi:hypothetical protein
MSAMDATAASITASIIARTDLTLYVCKRFINIELL